MENEFLAMDKIFSWLKSHFPSFSPANMSFLAWVKFFCPDKKYFVLTDEQGIILKSRNLIASHLIQELQAYVNRGIWQTFTFALGQLNSNAM